LNAPGLRGGCSLSLRATFDPYTARKPEQARRGAVRINMAPLLKLYPFKYRDPVSGVWTKAHYKATSEDISARYAEWTIDGVYRGEMTTI
jgi:hypothetical protein